MPSGRPSVEQKLEQACKLSGFKASTVSSAVDMCLNVRKDQSKFV